MLVCMNLERTEYRRILIGEIKYGIFPLLKVRQSWKQIVFFSILPKNEQTWLSWLKKMLRIVRFVRFLGELRKQNLFFPYSGYWVLFFWKNWGSKNCFWDLLTFNLLTYHYQLNLTTDRDHWRFERDWLQLNYTKSK